VDVATYRPFYIIGAVNRPGQYPYVDHMTALNAVALAGGFTPSAVESVVFIRREGSNEEIEVPADRTTDIRPGDVVKVHTTLFSDAVSLLSPFSGVAASAATETQLRGDPWPRSQSGRDRQCAKARHHRRALPVGKPQPCLRHGRRAEGSLR